jgi:hypothetical protein
LLPKEEKLRPKLGKKVLFHVDCIRSRLVFTTPKV